MPTYTPYTSPKSSSTLLGPAPGGSRLWASLTLLRSSSHTWGSCAFLNPSLMNTWMIERPRRERDSRRLIWPMRWISRSSTWVTSRSTSSALAPG